MRGAGRHNLETPLHEVGEAMVIQALLCAVNTPPPQSLAANPFARCQGSGIHSGGEFGSGSTHFRTLLRIMCRTAGWRQYEFLVAQIHQRAANPPRLAVKKPRVQLQDTASLLSVIVRGNLVRMGLSSQGVNVDHSLVLKPSGEHLSGEDIASQ